MVVLYIMKTFSEPLLIKCLEVVVITRDTCNKHSIILHNFIFNTTYIGKIFIVLKLKSSKLG